MGNKKIGRYEVEKELGRGAMAVVYRAVDPLIGRVVAIKTLRLEHGVAMEKEEQLQRLYREAQSAGNLNHPSIVTIYDIGQEGDLAYIAMEFIEGESLENWLATHRMPPLEQTLRIIEQVADGLGYAAARGITHRDIKPGNILLDAELKAKIADFGIAKLSMSNLTQTGTVMGTPSYMSPEQAMGQDLDGRSDIFSLGIILYEMLTGERPFTGTNPNTIIYKILHEEPVPPRKLNITLHPGLDIIVRKMLAKDPAQRYQNCGDLIKALRDYASLTEAPAARARKKSAPAAGKRRRLLPVALTVIVVAAAALGVFLYQRLQEVPPPPELIAGHIPETPPPPPVLQEPYKGETESSAGKILPPPDETAAAPKEEEPSPPPPPPPPPATVQLHYSGAPYPVSLFDGRKKLGSFPNPSRPVRVPPGGHRFRIVSPEVFLDRSLGNVELKPDQQHVIQAPGLGSAYIEVPNDAYDGCEILLNEVLLPAPYPAQIQRLAAGSHKLTFRWKAGRYTGLTFTADFPSEQDHHYLVRGNPGSETITVQRVR